MKTLAILSPDQNAYSETFIQMHRKLPYNIKYYYSGFLPSILEGGKDLLGFSLKERIEKKIRKQFSLREYALFYSLKREKADVVLAEYGTTGSRALNVIKALHLPLVVHFHGYDASVQAVKELYGPAYQELFSYADRVVAVSGKMKDDLVNMKCPEEKIVISTYGPDPAFFDNNPAYQSKQFIAVGRFVEKKAPQSTIQAFKIVAEKFPAATLKMVGAGELFAECIALAASLDLSDKIEFMGVQPPEVIKQAMEDSIAFVQHSVVASNGDSEGTPVAILEAQAAALPVVATDHAGIPEVVLHNTTGLLSEEKDIEAMSQNMIKVLTQTGLAEQLGQNGRKRIREHFTLDKHLQTLQDIINKSLQSVH